MLGDFTSANCSRLTTSNTRGSVIASNIALSVVMGLIAITSVLSNGLVIASVAKTPWLQKPANLMVCSLSLSDLLTGLTTIPLSVTSRLLFLHVSVSVCVYQTVVNVFDFCLYIFTGVSFAQLCLLSWDRYKAVSNPLVYRSDASNHKTLKAIAVTWLAWITVGISMKLIPESRLYLQALSGALFLMFPTAMQVATYKAIRRHNREITATGSQAVAATALAREKKFLTTLRYVLAALFFSLVTPIVVFAAMVSTKAVVSVQSDIVAWADIFVFINSCINPMIYFLRHADMRTAACGLIGH